MDAFWTLAATVAAGILALARMSLSLQKAFVERWMAESAHRDARHAAALDRLVQAVGEVRQAVVETNTLLRRQSEWRAATFAGEDAWRSL